VQRWLAAGQPDARGRGRQEVDDLPGPVEQPAVFPVLGWLGAHQAVVVALLGEQNAVVSSAALPQDGDPEAVSGDANDVPGGQVAQLRRQAYDRARGRGVRVADQVHPVAPGHGVLAGDQACERDVGGRFVGRADPPDIGAKVAVQSGGRGPGAELHH
jgi:hypothetical protein